jgi:hypothetical protein
VGTPKLCSSQYATVEASRVMREVEISNAITKLYENVERYSAEDCWYFDIPLAI